MLIRIRAFTACLMMLLLSHTGKCRSSGRSWMLKSKSDHNRWFCSKAERNGRQIEVNLTTWRMSLKQNAISIQISRGNKEGYCLLSLAWTACITFTGWSIAKQRCRMLAPQLDFDSPTATQLPPTKLQTLTSVKR